MHAISEGFEQYLDGCKIAWNAEEQAHEPLPTSLPAEALESGRPAQDVPSGRQWLSLPAAPESARRARRFAAEVLSEVAESDPVHVDDVVLVVSELVTNAIRAVAALGPALEASVRLGIAAGPRWTHLYAVDTAPALPEETHRGLLAGSGRGIPIITTLAALAWIEQSERDKTIHVVLTRTGIDTRTLTPEKILRSERSVAPLQPPARPGHDNDALLRPREVARMFGVRPSTIARWAREGRLTPLFTSGGHRRYRLDHIRILLTATELDPIMVDDAVRLYEQGWTIRQVAARFEYGYGAMRRVLKNHTTLRARGGPPGRQRA